MASVTFLPDGERLYVDEGATLREAAIKAGFLNCKGDRCNSCWGLLEIEGEPCRGCDHVLKEDVVVNTINPREEEHWRGDKRLSEITKVALDIGTTTITAAFYDNSGRKIGSKAVINPQIVYGRDIISRIYAINRDTDLLKKMHSKLLARMNELIEEFTYIEEIGIAGNPFMEHLFLGISPSRIGAYPYDPEFKESMQIDASELGLNAGCEAFLFPLISGWVGGDLVAMVLSTGIYKSDDLIMGIDLGTNGEVVLGSKEEMVTTSIAAGPALEAVGITYGIPAVDGSIERVNIDKNGRSKVKVKGGGKAKGICGSGVIHAIAEMLKRDILDKRGMMKSKRFYLHDRFCITQKDVRKVQLVRSAILTAMSILRQELNLSPKKTIVTGSLGEKSVDNLSILGIQDAIFKKDAVVEGIKLALFGRKREAETIAKKLRWIDLASHPSFSDEFIKNLEF